MKVLLTGGAGYIGSNVVYSLIEEGHEVIVIDNLSKGYEENLHKKVVFYNVDLKDKTAIANVFTIEKDISVVMDFAASISVPESMDMPLDYFDNNFLSVRNLIEVMKDFGVKNFIFSSTATIYGNPTKIPIEETDLAIPINPYGASKLIGEIFLKWVAPKYGINFIIFRYFNVAGTHSSLEVGIRNIKVSHLIPSINNVFLGIKDEFVVFGTDYSDTRDGSCLRDYIHVTDLAKAHIQGAEYLLKHKGVSEIFNLGSKNGYTVLEVKQAAEKLFHRKIPTKLEGRRAGDPSTLLASNQKARAILNWQPKYELHDMIQSDFDFRKKVFTKWLNKTNR